MKNNIKFGTGGFRGIIGETFTKYNIQLVAQAICNLIIEEKSTKPVVVGFDYRFLSDKAAEWMSEVFAYNNIPVLLSNSPVPTPAVMFMTKSLDNDFGVMITASHNPYYFNGIKVFQKQGMDADIELTSRIEKQFDKIEEVKKKPIELAIKDSDVKVVSFLTDYVVSIKRWILPKVYGSEIRVLFDNLHGVGGRSLTYIAKELDLKNFRTIGKSQDAFFGNKLPNPTRENMESDRKYLKHGNYDCVLGLDSDGDRLGILDELGNYVDSNELLSCIYYYLIKYRGMKGDSVKNCATSNLVNKVTEKFGYKCHEVDVGFKNISGKMKEVDALLGGESSGGLTVRGYLYGKDSSFAASLFIEMLVVMGKSVSEIVKEVREFAKFNHVIMEDNISYNNEDVVLNYVRTKTIEFPDKVIKREQFGKNIKYYFANDCWALLRCSGTEPVLRLFVEMETKEKTQQYLKILKDSVKSVDTY